MPKVEKFDGKEVTDEMREKLNLNVDICLNPSAIVNRWMEI